MINPADYWLFPVRLEKCTARNNHLPATFSATAEMFISYSLGFPWRESEIWHMVVSQAILPLTPPSRQ